MKQNMDQPSCKWNLLRLFALICTTFVSTLSFGQAGNAPMVALPNFPGPMAIDGFVTRQGAAGDWLPGPGGATNTVFTAGCVKLVPIAYRLVDLWDDQTNDEIFDGGNKLNDNPNDWGWRSQKPPAKDDINTAMVFIAINPVDNHIWLAISGDRLSTNGTSYLDFEFYQNPITMTGGPIPGGTGGFTSTGPHNGRTIGDISITLEFTGGGSLATVSYQQWQAGSEAGTYDYFSVTPDPGTAYAAANAGVIDVPCGAFGETTYQPLQFAEGAIDLTALIGGTGLPGECGSLPFQSLFIKTKSSASNTADLKDFIAPFSISVCFDVTPPVINCPAPLVLGCNPTIPGPSGATASDNCSGAVIPVAADGPVSSNGCNRSMTRTWRATDNCGNTSTCAQSITWTEDNTGPSINGVGANSNLGCNPANITFSTATASDGCLGNTTLTSSTSSDVAGANCSVSRTRTWTARDACGNTSTASQTLTWTADVGAPVISGVGANSNLGCNPANITFSSPTSSDACGNTTLTSSTGSDVAGANCSVSRTRSWTARDGCGNTATASQTLTWTADLGAPVISGVGANANLGCNPANITFSTATSSDACGNTTLTSSTGSDVAGANCSVSRTRTWNAVDVCGNTASASQTLTWTADLGAPVISGVGANANLGCNPANITFSSPTSSDACGNTTLTLSTGSDVAGANCSVSRTRTWTARDGCGNTATAAQTLTWTADLGAPVISGVGANANLGCNPANITFSTPTASDACGNVTFTSSTGSDVAGANCSVSRTRTWNAVDACGNTASASQTLTWTADLGAPVISGVGPNTDLGAQQGCNVVEIVFSSPTSSDACGPTTLTFSTGSDVNGASCSVSRTRTWTARDGCGNTATAAQTITWRSDQTPPVISGVGANSNLGCNPANITFSTPTASDACSNATLTSSTGSDVAGANCSVSRTRTWTARDACNNTSTAAQTLTWTADLGAPVISGVGANANLGCNPANITFSTATSSDACGNTTLTSSTGSDVAGANCTVSRTRTWNAVDVCGNTASASQTLTWTADLGAPVISGVGANSNLGCNPANITFSSPTSSDACGNTTLSSSTGSDVAGANCSVSRTRTWTARDVCGNTATASQTLTWTADLGAPVISGVGANANLGCNPANITFSTPTSSDACGNTTLTSSTGSDVAGANCTVSRTRTWTARDVCGNTSSGAQTLTWTADLTAPVFTNAPASVDLPCNTALPEATLPTASDACGPTTVTAATATDNATDCATGFSRVVTRKWTARDACGNTSTASQTIRIACCPAAICTYTQGAYGTEGGSMCDGENGGFSTLEFIANSLANWGGSFTVGKPGNSVLVNSAQCVIDKLPGGGPAKELVAGNINLCNFTPLQPNGGVRNILLAQTITLGLNLGIEDSQLGSFVLQAGELATQDPVGGCGGETPETRVCHYNTLAPYNLISVENEYTYRTFTQALIDAIPGPNTVANLYELANRALANVDGVEGSEGGVSLGAIAEALGSVNEVFDECKIVVGWNVARCPAIDPTPGDGRIAATTTVATPSLVVTAFPNPYEENFSLRVNSPVTGQALVGFYTMDGVKIGEVKKDVVANKDVWVPYNVPAAYRTRIVYTVGVGKYTAKGIVLSPN